MTPLEQAEAAQAKSTRRRNPILSDDDLVDLIIAYFRGTVKNAGIKAVLHDERKTGNPALYLMSRLPRLVREGRLKVVKPE